ncbi:MAG: HAD hydrolase-like protein [Ignavibacteriales bacterium]|nr:MAG: HAD hydrolase-like protein [Ignavibacteriales bacterium]
MKHPLLIDFDGVINLNGKIAPDAKSFLGYLVKEKIPSLILSNSTLKSSADIQKYLEVNGIDLNIPSITTVDASVEFLKKHYKTASVYCGEKVKHHFSDIPDSENPEAILIGDLEQNWTYEILNEMLLKVLNGAEIIAMQKNRYWKKDEKILMDAGSFVSALEFASSKKSLLIGKPSELYYSNALAELGFTNNETFFMLGDAVESDIVPVQRMNGKGILIYSGKTKYPFKEKTVKPDYETFNLTDVIRILSEL